MSTTHKNEGLAQANQRAAERARIVAKKMQADMIKRLEQKEAKKKAAEDSNKK